MRGRRGRCLGHRRQGRRNLKNAAKVDRKELKADPEEVKADVAATASGS